jgi:hypothetical protein
MATTEDQVDADAGPDLAGPELEVSEPPVEVDGAGSSHEQDIERRIGQGKRIKKRVRKMLVSLHRWLSFVLLAWVIVISLTGAWLVFGDKFDSLFHSEWYHQSPGDVGPAVAIAAVSEELPDLKDGAYVYYEVMPTNGRGVYQVSVAEPHDADGLVEKYFNFYVDPGTGEVNGMRDEEKGFTHWMYRGHEYMWQDHGIFGVFTPGTGWCAPNADGAEPGGAKGVVCDVIPDGLDMIAWLGGGLFFILISGFYIWYWPNVRRWATALQIKRRRGRFQFHLSLHNAVGLVVIVPLLIITFTGMAFAFPNMKSWYENLTPAHRGSTIWETSEDSLSTPIEGADPLDADGLRETLTEAFPDRTLISIVGPPTGETDRADRHRHGHVDCALPTSPKACGGDQRTER